jgi:hypothetical protein
MMKSQSVRAHRPKVHCEGVALAGCLAVAKSTVLVRPVESRDQTGQNIAPAVRTVAAVAAAVYIVYIVPECKYH